MCLRLQAQQQAAAQAAQTAQQARVSAKAQMDGTLNGFMRPAGAQPSKPMQASAAACNCSPYGESLLQL